MGNAHMEDLGHEPVYNQPPKTETPIFDLESVKQAVQTVLRGIGQILGR